LLLKGLVVIAPDYIKSRIKGGAFPAGLEDCYTTLQYISTHKEELGISNQIATLKRRKGSDQAGTLASNIATGSGSRLRGGGSSTLQGDVKTKMLKVANKAKSRQGRARVWAARCSRAPACLAQIEFSTTAVINSTRGKHASI
jgi:hypothetical protein